MRILGMNIKSDIFNTTKSTTTDLILHQWGKVYRRTASMLDVYRPTKEAFKDRLALVHTVQKVHQNDSPLLLNKAEDVIAGWDIISTSLTRLQSSMYDRNQWADVGLILAVPPQNVIGTFHHDVWFLNHAGTVETKRYKKNSYALAQCYFKGISKFSRDPEMKRYLKKVMPDHTYAYITDPDTLIAQSDGTTHNEVLIVGKKDVNIYENYPPTGRIKVCGLYFQHYVGQKKNIPAYRDNRELLEKLIALNPDLPIIEQAVWSGSASDFKW